MPETGNRVLPTNVDEANNFEVDQKYFDCMLCCKQNANQEDLEKENKEDPLLVQAKVVECEILDSISLRQSTNCT